MAKTNEIHVTTVFDGELTPLMCSSAPISEIRQDKYKKNIFTKVLAYNEDEVQKSRIPSGLCVGKWL